MTASDDFLAAFFKIPIGTTTGKSRGKRYVVSRSIFANGRSHKLVASQLGGNDYVSLNLYQTRKGALLRPCEMTARKVIEFVTSFRPDVSSANLQF